MLLYYDLEENLVKKEECFLFSYILRKHDNVFQITICVVHLLLDQDARLFCSNPVQCQWRVLYRLHIITAEQKTAAPLLSSAEVCSAKGV